MSNEHSVRGRSLVLEGTAVLAAILIAFGMDAAWEARQERQSEQDYLFSLLSELDANRSAIQESIDLTGQDIEKTEGYLIAVAAEFLRPISQDALRSMTWNMSPIRATPLRRAAFEDLISGGLQLVQDPEIRRLILDYGRAIEVDALRQLMSQNWFDQRAQVYDELHADLVGMGSLFSGGWAGRTDLRFDVDTEAFVANRTYANLLAQRVFRVRRLRRVREDLLARLEELHARLSPG